MEISSKIYGAWAYRVPNPEKDFSKFPPDDGEFIDMISGKFEDLRDLPEDFLRNVKGKANIIAIGKGDRFEVFRV